MQPPSVKYRLHLLISTLLLVATWGLQAAELRIQGESISLRTRNEPLTDVLRTFANYGVTVRIQAGVEATVDGDLIDVPIEQALEKLLEGFGYATYWREFPYSADQLRVLDRIDVFPVGGRGHWIPVPRAERRILKLPSGAEYVADELLIGMRPGTSPDDFRQLLQSIGGQVVGIDSSIGMYRVRLPANANIPGITKRLSDDPRVGAAEPNLVFRIPKTESPGFAPSAGISETAKALTVSAAGSPIAILDSGLSPELANARFITGSFDASNPGQTIYDPVGHGSHMSLIASRSVTPAGAQTSEAAAPVLAIKAFDDEGMATSYQLTRSLQFAKEQGAELVSMSWGTYENSRFIEVAMQQAARQGLILLAAAGNDGSQRPMYPAAYPEVISVAATDERGRLWENSNRGGHVDLAAPGRAYFPAAPGVNGGHYAGTSIATPYVASTLAEYRNQNPAASIVEIKKALQAALSPLEGSSIRQLDAAARQRLLSR